MTAAARYLPPGWECVGPAWARSHERLGAILGRAKAEVEAAGLAWVDPEISCGAGGLLEVVFVAGDEVCFEVWPHGVLAFIWTLDVRTAVGYLDEDWAAAAVVRWHRRTQALVIDGVEHRAGDVLRVDLSAEETV